MKFCKYFSVLVGLVFLLPGAVCSAPGQAGRYTKLNPKGKKAYSIPVSDRLLKFEVTLATGEVAKILVKEGQMAKIGDLHDGYAFALVPVIKDLGKKSASFEVYQLTQDEAGNESIKLVEHLEANADAPTSAKTEPGFQIRMVSIEEPKATSMPSKASR